MAVIFLAAALSVVFSSAPLSAGTISFSPASAPPVQMDPLHYTAANWAGYAAETSFSGPQSNSVTAVSGSWIVPAITPSANPAANVPGQESNCVVWVGIDGFNTKQFPNNTVEQVGTECYILNGAVTYDGWIEMYPNGMFDNLLTVSPGDSVTASVQYNLPSYPNQFLLSLTDNTTHQGFAYAESAVAGSPPLRSSAEWIVEAPSEGSVLPLPTFGSTGFTGAQATIDGITGAINDPSWQVADIDMSDPPWNDAMTPSALTTVGSGATASSSFTVTQAPEPSTLVLLASALAVLCLPGLFRNNRVPRCLN